MPNGPSSLPSCHPRSDVGDPAQTIGGLQWDSVGTRSGARWCDLPGSYGSDSTCHRRLKEWQEEGVWERIWGRFLSTLEGQQQVEWKRAYLDGSFVSAKKGATK